MNAICIAGTNSGCGKTTVTQSIMAYFKKLNYNVAPFKAGPDYIDPKFHQYITGTPSINLDSFLLENNTIKYLFKKHTDSSDIAIIEGVMGIFDGTGTTGTASTAELVRLLKVPVILVVNASGMSRSAAALINGFLKFDKDINIAGIILNRISSESHYELLKKIITQNCNVKVCGYVKKESSFTLKSRHLGLVPVEELENYNNKVNKLLELTEATINFDEIFSISKTCEFNSDSKTVLKQKHLYDNIKIGYAIDKAFNFYYHDNLLFLQELGFKMIPFSPMNDKKLPEGIKGLYIGGGFPEIFAKQLSQNHTFLKDIKDKLESGLPCYAECGGLMYLAKGIYTKENGYYPMTGFFNSVTRMTDKLQKFGYVYVKLGDISTNAHEFHHSILVEDQEPDYKMEYSIIKASRPLSWECGLHKKNVLAGYAHVHFYSNIDFSLNLVNNFLFNK